MTTFTDAADEFIDLSENQNRRRELWHHFVRTGLPTVADEVWRYAPLSDFRLENFAVALAPGTFVADTDWEIVTSSAQLVIEVVDGHLVAVRGEHPGVTVTAVDAGTCAGERTYEDRYDADAFALLNGALSPGTICVTVAPDTHVTRPIVIVHQVSGAAAFPATRVVLARSSSLSVIEAYRGGANALVAPISEYVVGENASLTMATYQRLEDTCWHVARTTALLERDARMRQSVIGLGAHYNRARNDAEFLGSGAHNDLHTTFLGSGHQVHDFRTHQFHRVGRTSCVLLSKGAVADHSRSVYTGLIEIEKGARRTDARQTNLNLLLAPTAHADTVPNLDIRENDVVCAHASSVGPLDEMQRWYLESRGVPRDVAERLLVQGFFNEMTASMPSDVAVVVDAEVARILATTQLVAT